MSEPFHFEEFDDENKQTQAFKISNLLPENWQRRDAEWKMDRVCPGLSVTQDGSVVFDSIAYNNQSGYKWSEESMWFSATDKNGETIYLHGTFSV